MFEHFFPSWWRCWKVTGPLGGGDLLGDSRALLVAFDGYSLALLAVWGPLSECRCNVVGQLLVLSFTPSLQ